MVIVEKKFNSFYLANQYFKLNILYARKNSQ